MKIPTSIKQYSMMTMLLLTSTIISSCSGGFEALGYTSKGEIQMTPKGLAGNDDFVAAIVAPYNNAVGDNGSVTYVKATTDDNAYDSYTIVFRATQTTDDAAISAVKNVNLDEDEWKGKLPAGNWYTSFKLAYCKYGGGSSANIKWEKEKNLLDGVWTGTTTDGKELMVIVNDELTDVSTHKWTTNCSIIYDKQAHAGTLSCVVEMSLINGVPTYIATGTISIEDDATTSATIVLNVTTSASATSAASTTSATSATTCAVTKLIISGTEIINVEDITKGVALKLKE